MTADPSAAGASGFGAESTTDEVIAGIDLSGRTILVTGASAGLGTETSRVLAGAGARVLMAVRSRQKGEKALADIREHIPTAALELVELDLADLDSVRACAAHVAADYPLIDVLINNAGVMACPLARTAQGYEQQFGTNHLGHFLLTGLLLPQLRAAPAARVVNLSSAGHKFAPVDFVDWNFESRPYDKWLAYGQAKTANALFSVGLGQHGISAFAVHPGAIVTELSRYLSREDIQALTEQDAATGPEFFYKSVAQGAATSVWAATAPQLEGKSGLYLEDCNVGEPAREDSPAKGYLPYARDPVLAEKLWSLSEQLVGQHFE